MLEGTIEDMIHCDTPRSTRMIRHPSVYVPCHDADNRRKCDESNKCKSKASDRV